MLQLDLWRSRVSEVFALMLDSLVASVFAQEQTSWLPVNMLALIIRSSFSMLWPKAYYWDDPADGRNKCKFCLCEKTRLTIFIRC